MNTTENPGGGMSVFGGPFQAWWNGLDYWFMADPGLACAQRAWNAALEHAAARVADRGTRVAILSDAVHVDELIP